MVAVIWVVLFLPAVVWFLWFRRTPLYRAHRRVGVVSGQSGATGYRPVDPACAALAGCTEPAAFGRLGIPGRTPRPPIGDGLPQRAVDASKGR
jgi:hypothetical protein